MVPRAVFSTASFPTVEYVSALVTAQEVLMENSEHYIKQTNRNRYHIAAPGGIQSLHIPLVHANLYNVPIREVCISYDFPWQRNHWRAIQSAYNRSAYFEFYSDELHSVFFKPVSNLFDFNLTLLRWILKCLRVDLSIITTDAYKETWENATDLRNISNQKNTVPGIIKKFERYPQVFESRNGFIRNLSILDLLFNTGPSASLFL
jgi:hypothetical protein